MDALHLNVALSMDIVALDRNTVAQIKRQQLSHQKPRQLVGPARFMAALQAIVAVIMDTVVPLLITAKRAQVHHQARLHLLVPVAMGAYSVANTLPLSATPAGLKVFATSCQAKDIRGARIHRLDHLLQDAGRLGMMPMTTVALSAWLGTHKTQVLG